MSGPSTSFPNIHGRVPAKVKAATCSSLIESASTSTATKATVMKAHGTPWAKYMAQRVPRRAKRFSCKLIVILIHGPLAI